LLEAATGHRHDPGIAIGEIHLILGPGTGNRFLGFFATHLQIS
jgi:hypothetical protein